MMPLAKLPRGPLCVGLALAIAAITIIIIRDDNLAAYLPILHNSTTSPLLAKLPTRPQWTLSEAPEFCKRIVDKPMQHQRWTGQFLQDYYLYTHHFSKLKRRGIYLDLAANEATTISNTYFFDSCLGWDGICIEPNPRYFNDLRRYRTCGLVEKCVSDVEGERVTFIMGEGLSGIQETNKNSKARLDSVHPKNVKMTCTTPRKVLKDYGVSVIDYMSLDIEGHELRALQGFDWSNTLIKVMTVEVTGRSVKELTDFLERKGFVRHRPTLNAESNRTNLLGEDAVFVHHTVTFGSPV